MMMITITSGQSNLTKRPHRHCTWKVQWCSPGGANVHPTCNTCFLGRGIPESTTQMPSRSVQPFLHSSRQSVIWHAWTCLFPQNYPLSIGESVPLSNTWISNDDIMTDLLLDLKVKQYWKSVSTRGSHGLEFSGTLANGTFLDHSVYTLFPAFFVFCCCHK